MRFHSTLLLAFPLVLAACGGPIGRCETNATVAGAGMCRTWTGDRTAPEEAFRELCTETLGGVFTAGAECGAENRVGSCYTDQLHGLFLTYSYYSPTYTADLAQQACESRQECDQSSCEWRPETT